MKEDSFSQESKMKYQKCLNNNMLKINHINVNPYDVYDKLNH